MSFRFIHAADLHLGSPLIGIASRDPELASHLASASRQAFTALVDQAIALHVAFLVIAGDIYDGGWKDTSIGLFFNRQVSRLVRAGIPVYTLRGNHDAESVVTQSVRLPDGVHEFPSRSAHTYWLEAEKVALHGRSFPNRAVSENYALTYPPPRPGWFNIGVLHTSCDGRPGHDRYAPCSLDELVSRGYQYWALGHIHAYEQLHSNPHVFFPGNLQGRGIHECGAKGALLVEVNGEDITAERLILDRARWYDVAVDIEGVAELDELHARLSALLARCLSEADPDSRLILARIRLQGRTTLHPTLHSSKEQIRDDVQATLQHFGENVWLEQLMIETEEPLEIAAGAAVAVDALNLCSALDTIIASSELAAEANHLIAEVVRKLPAGASEQDIFGPLNIDRLIAEARERLLIRTGTGQEGRE